MNVTGGKLYYPMDLIDGLEDVRFGGYNEDMSSFTVMYDEDFYKYTLIISEVFANGDSTYEPFEVQGKKF